MKKLFKGLLIVLLVFAIIRVGLGSSGDIHVMDIVHYLGENGEVVNLENFVVDYNIFHYQVKNLQNFFNASQGETYTFYRIIRDVNSSEGSVEINSPSYVYDIGTSSYVYRLKVSAYVEETTKTKFSIGGNIAETIVSLGGFIKDFFTGIWDVIVLSFSLLIDVVWVSAQAVWWFANFLFTILFEDVPVYQPVQPI